MKIYEFAKRCCDIIFALTATMILLPIFLVVVLVIHLESSGMSIFKQKRAGINGRPFTFYKFRTMRTDVDPFGPSPKSGEDVRLTKVGKFLREYSLDELPQLFNVIKGDMSMVGPRPLYMSQIAEWDQRQRKRLNVKPGLTGLAQISGRASLTREEKLELDVQYVEKANLLLDMKIFLQTIAQIFTHRDIYEKRYSSTEYTRGGRQ